jgi:hypothetical protein
MDLLIYKRRKVYDTLMIECYCLVAEPYLPTSCLYGRGISLQSATGAVVYDPAGSTRAAIFKPARDKEGVSMTKFDFNEERLSIIDAHNQCVNLGPREAVQLLEWLSARETILRYLARQDATLLNERSEAEASGSQMEQLEIHLLPQQMVHLDELQEAIPQLQEYIPATNVYVSPIDAVTERAIALLKEFEIEYKIHPLLEDSDEFAQG